MYYSCARIFKSVTISFDLYCTKAAFNYQKTRQVFLHACKTELTEILHISWTEC